MRAFSLQLPSRSSGRAPEASARVPPWAWAAALLLVIIAGAAPPLLSGALVVGLIVGALLLLNPVWGAYGLVLSVPVQKLVAKPIPRDGSDVCASELRAALAR